MELINYVDYIKKVNLEKLTITIGDFDGVHIAHQTLLKKVVELGDLNHQKTAVITFDPHPAMLLNKKKNLLINDLNTKYELLSKWNIDYLIIINFTKDFSQISPLDFVNDYLLKLNVSTVVVGFDFKFGYLGKGSAQDISVMSNGLITTYIIDKIVYKEEKIGSSRIRESLLNGNLDEVFSMLGGYYSFSGQVIYGKQVGSKINLPTANIDVGEEFAVLRKGVYAVIVLIDNVKKYGMMNVGNNPSFNYTKKRSYEVHIFDFNNDIYGKRITVECVKFIRPEKKFNSVDDFLNQIEIDRMKIYEIFNRS